MLLLAIGFVGYWLYKHVLFSDAPPSCKELQNDCLRICRRTTSEAPDYQACEQRCNQQAEACQGK